ncbi:hypothetical protein QFZ75_003687 [Streptomyces sp. V3I8]|nr:hypothetical protein [Streptomyces sp. V3I8]MDQ1037271.1 hypothetical protein [Streptomyces sp. V3I8]
MPLIDTWRRQLARDEAKLADLTRAIARLKEKIAKAEKREQRRGP